MVEKERDTPVEIIRGLGELGQDMPVYLDVSEENQTPEIITDKNSPSGAEQLD